MPVIPPNENGSTTPKTTAYKPTPMPIRGMPRPPVAQPPVRMPIAGVGDRPPIGKRLGGSTYFANKGRIALNRNAKKMNYAQAAKRKLMGK